MPKDTFINLSEDKKQRIYQAALQEFSTRRFSDASINQIIKTAGIPRGSFYQYFNDKEDIFLYMFAEILNEKREVLRRTIILDESVDLFEAYLLSTRATLEWSAAHPEYNRISLLMEIDDSGFIAKLREDSASGLKQLIERDKQRGWIKPDIDSDLLVEMIYTLTVREYNWLGLDSEMFLERIQKVFRIIREGISLKPPEA